MGKKKIGGGRKKRTVWWNEEVRNAMKLKNKEYRKWMKTRTEVNRREYVRARNHAEDVKRRNKDSTWIRIGRELKEDMQGTRKLVYGMAKNMKASKEPETHGVLNKEGEPLLEATEV